MSNNVDKSDCLSENPDVQNLYTFCWIIEALVNIPASYLEKLGKKTAPPPEKFHLTMENFPNFPYFFPTFA